MTDTPADGGSHPWSRRMPAPESVSRLVNFTDAVVAIAITLLILPILDLEPTQQDESVFELMSANSGKFFAFGLSFLVVLALWRRNHDLLDGLRSYTPRLVMINSVWLLGIVFLQFPTEQLGSQEGFANGVGTLYWGSLAIVTAVGLVQALYLERHVELLDEPYQRHSGRDLRIRLEIVYMVALAILYWFFPHSSPWLAAGLAAFGWLDAWEEHRSQRPTGQQ